MSTMSIGALWKLRRITRGQAIIALAPLWAILATLALVCLVLLAMGKDPVQVYGALLYGAVGNWYNFGVTTIRAVPLLFSALAVAFAYRCGLFNIGAEGQLQMGALASIVVALYFVDVPPPERIAIAVLAGFLAGAIWGGVAGVFKARWGVSEIVVTIMLSYIAQYFVMALVQGPMMGKEAAFASTEVLAKDLWLPFVIPGTRIHAGFLLAVAATIAVWFILRKTTLGFQIRSVGLNATAARFSGISVAKSIVIAMLISGGLAGLTGSSEVLGVQHRLSETWSLGWGYTAIAVALLGRADPVGVFLAAFFFGALDAGATNMQAMTSLPQAFVSIMQGLPVVILLAITSRGGIRELLTAKARKGGKVNGSPEHAV